MVIMRSWCSGRTQLRDCLLDRLCHEAFDIRCYCGIDSFLDLLLDHNLLLVHNFDQMHAHVLPARVFGYVEFAALEL